MPKPRVPKTSNSDAVVQPGNGAPSNGAVEASSNQTAKPKKSDKKTSIVKPETRANLVPINLEDEIRRLAYLLSERRGFEPGHETEDWLAAEHEVRQRYHHQYSA
jgi:Protein of unknown function (DUF2934)